MCMFVTGMLNLNVRDYVSAWNLRPNVGSKLNICVITDNLHVRKSVGAQYASDAKNCRKIKLGPINVERLLINVVEDNCKTLKLLEVTCYLYSISWPPFTYDETKSMFRSAHSHSRTKNAGLHGYARTWFFHCCSIRFLYVRKYNRRNSLGHLDVASMMCAREARKWSRGYVFILAYQTNIFVVDELRILRNVVNEEL